jgi:hypothetical protein
LVVVFGVDARFVGWAWVLPAIIYIYWFQRLQVVGSFYVRRSQQASQFTLVALHYPDYRTGGSTNHLKALYTFRIGGRFFDYEVTVADYYRKFVDHFMQHHAWWQKRSSV